ncbi:MAG TPA: hypothetical protein EYN72_00125 [Dehalococcoidia bacterium]|nr:hypothetical protein [Dehalococcoidia bacterium]
MQDQFVPNFAWHHPTRIVYGIGKLRDLPTEVGNLTGHGSSVFLVTGRSSLQARGILQSRQASPGKRDRADQPTPLSLLY